MWTERHEARQLPGSKKKTEQETQSAKAPPKTHQSSKPISDWETVTVRSYDGQKGRGFLSRGEGKQDAIVYADVLKSCDIRSLMKGQKIDVKCVPGS